MNEGASGVRGGRASAHKRAGGGGFGERGIDANEDASENTPAGELVKVSTRVVW